MAKAKDAGAVSGQETAPAIEVVGLERSDYMPIHFDNRLFDLASLTPEDTAFLLQFPQQVPYLKVLV